MKLGAIFLSNSILFLSCAFVSPSERAEAKINDNRQKNDTKNDSRRPIISSDSDILCSALLLLPFLPHNHKKYDIVSCCLLLSFVHLNDEEEAADPAVVVIVEIIVMAKEREKWSVSSKKQINK